MISLKCTQLISGSRVLSRILVQKSSQGSMVSPLKPRARSQNWQKKIERDGSTTIWKGSWYLSLRKQIVLREGKTLQRASWKYEQKGGRIAGESSGFSTLVGSYPSFKYVQQAGLHLYCHLTLQGLPVVQLTLLNLRVCSKDCADLRVDSIQLIIINLITKNNSSTSSEKQRRAEKGKVPANQQQKY